MGTVKFRGAEISVTVLQRRALQALLSGKDPTPDAMNRSLVMAGLARRGWLDLDTETLTEQGRALAEHMFAPRFCSGCGDSIDRDGGRRWCGPCGDDMQKVWSARTRANRRARSQAA